MVVVVVRLGCTHARTIFPSLFLFFFSPFVRSTTTVAFFLQQYFYFFSKKGRDVGIYLQTTASAAAACTCVCYQFLVSWPREGGRISGRRKRRRRRRRRE